MNHGQVLHSIHIYEEIRLQSLWISLMLFWAIVHDNHLNSVYKMAHKSIAWIYKYIIITACPKCLDATLHINPNTDTTLYKNDCILQNSYNKVKRAVTRGAFPPMLLYKHSKECVNMLMAACFTWPLVSFQLSDLTLKHHLLIFYF